MDNSLQVEPIISSKSISPPSPREGPTGETVKEVTHIRLVSHDLHLFPTMVADLTKPVKIGGVEGLADQVQDAFSVFCYETKVVSGTHAEIFEENGKVLSQL